MASSRKFLQPINLLNAASDPGSAVEGDFYYNTTSQTIRYYDGSQWNDVGTGTGGTGITVSETAPTATAVGEGWFKSSTSELFVWDGTFWVEATSTVQTLQLFTVGSTPPSSPSEGAGWFDNVNGDFYIYDGTYWQQVNSVVQLTQMTADIDANGFGFDNVDHISFDTTSTYEVGEGEIAWNSGDQTLNIGLANGVVLQTGQESHVYAKNETGSTIANGKVVHIVGSGETLPNHSGHPLIAEFIADGSINAADVLGVTTQDIGDDEHGYVTAFGMVRDIDTSSYPAGTVLYASSSNSGDLTDLQPTSPDLTVVLGVVVESSSETGSIFINPRIYPAANLVTYDNDSSNLISSNVQGAIDELSITKADINSLSSSLTVYPTSVESDISGYYRMVESIDDTDYDDPAVDISTGDLDETGTDHLISSLISDAGIFVGSPGSINVTTIGNIAKTSGNANAYSEFFFRMYKRDSGGTETLLGTSSTTGPINPTVLDSYEQFSASGNFLLGDFAETDRVVIKYYSNVINDGSQSYEFEFGGDQPVRTLIPVPVSVIASTDASGIILDTSNFNGVLSSSDTTVQNAMDTLDDLDVLPDQTGNSGKYLTTDGTNTSWDDVDALTLEGNSASYFTGYADASAAAASAALVNSAPETLNTLNELAAALNDDANFATTVTDALALKAPLADPALTGTPTAPTATSGTNTTQIATTEFVQLAISSFDALPDQTGNAGKYLTTDGTNTSWGDVDALPSQTGNNGKYLTTDGTTASWETVESGSAPVQTDVALSNSWWLGV
jgi:hypothetical protein